MVFAPISLAIPELEIQSSKVELSNGLCSISLAIPELEIQSSKVELSNGLCSISLAIPELELQLKMNYVTKLTTHLVFQIHYFLVTSP